MIQNNVVFINIINIITSSHVWLGKHISIAWIYRGTRYASVGFQCLLWICLCRDFPWIFIIDGFILLSLIIEGVIGMAKGGEIGRCVVGRVYCNNPFDNSVIGFCDSTLMKICKSTFSSIREGGSFFPLSVRLISSAYHIQMSYGFL